MRRLPVFTAILLLAAPAMAQSGQAGSGMPMGGMHMEGAPAANEAPSTKAYRHAMTEMDQGMNVPYTGDADRDFATGMIPHHQGAVDMARVELKYGKDPALKKLARSIIASQEKEIAFMKQWQAKHAK